ncbi:Pleiotropic drug resistance protein 3 [Hibiscus syriacus]|uniref:Pleiotropic drug resistance protein 3 n=1 Tax=Hibiscus syriacus TaxID=106335 RepID=A0A6A2YN62_HIBSY|nr:Pleiotropic drug resistance protein 3 [Hibiscus syriacus]
MPRVEGPSGRILNECSVPHEGIYASCGDSISAQPQCTHIPLFSIIYMGNEIERQMKVKVIQEVNVTRRTRIRVGYGLGCYRKRVTTGELMVGPAKVLFMDEISTGLDSSTTFQIVNSLKQSVHILDETAVISLLQPAPETYDLFDDIILLSDGRIVYHGPREDVLSFFEYMGFKCPERKGVADFLQEVTSRKDQKQYWVRKDQPYRFVTADEFSKAFQSFHLGKKLRDELGVPYEKTKSHPAALTTKMYGVGKKELLKACISREYLLMKRNSFVYIFKFIELTVMAFITMTLFLRTEMRCDSVVGGGIYMGALFFGLATIMFNGMAEISMTIAKLPVYKQRDLLFFPTWAYALPTWILKIPVSFAEVSVWVFLTYYVIGLDPNVGRLFKQYVILVLVNQMVSGLFRFIGAAGRNMVVANTFGAFALLILFALGGFILSREDIKKWRIWGYWISPMMYGQNALMVNEFLGNQWRRILPGSNESLGIKVLKSRGFFHDPNWYWFEVGGLLGFIVLFNFLYTLALAYLKPFEKNQAVISETPEEIEQTDGVGDKLQLSNNGSSSSSITRSGTRGSRDTQRSISSKSLSVSEATIGNKKKGMVLPFEPHSIAFDDVIYSVDMPQEIKEQGANEDKLVLLKGVSGSFRPGVLTALMGVSGAGKTTLMDVLAGRKTGGYIEGNINVSGFPKKQETFARVSGYCEQNDIHSPHVTVYESLLYSAWLRLPKEVGAETRKMFIDEVMDLVELNPLRQAQVGLPSVNGLSTEQRKRLTIAVELVANPSIIFMDEPTSGLDARAAAIVMRAVRNTVDTGRTVVCTIHQPSIDIFEAFDELFLMKRGGQEIYVGPLGHHSKHLIDYFEGIGVSKIKDCYNPAAWMLEVTTTAQELALGVDFADIYGKSDLYRRNKDLIKDLSKPAPGSKELYFPTQFSQPFLTQCAACLWKQRWSYWRNPAYTAVRLFFTTVIALMFWTLFWDLGTRTEKRQDLVNAMGSMYAAVLFLGIQNGASVQPVVAVERTVFYRERAAGMYSAMPYAIAQACFSPFCFCYEEFSLWKESSARSAVYGLIVYTMIAFKWTAAKFFWFLFFMYFTLLYITFYGMMTVAVTPNHHISAIVSSAFYGIWDLFSGFIIPRPFGDIPDVLEDGRTVEQNLRSYFGFRHEFIGGVAAIIIDHLCNAKILEKKKQVLSGGCFLISIMEGSDIYRASSSLRSPTSLAWRNNDVEPFSRSYREEDDEEALMWAALERLPTVSRLRKGILTSSEGGASEIDVHKLGWQQRKVLLERLVKVAEEDNEKLLLKLKNRVARVGIDLPTIEVRFEHLNIEAQAFVGTSALPTVLNFTTGIIEGFLNHIGILSSRKKKFTILNDVSGIIKPGRMALLLGPPSSGKTTLLLALAGKLDPTLKCSGTVTYNGHAMDEFVPQRTAAYISQHDLHIGEMTVRETLAFAARCQGVGERYEMLAELTRREKQANIKPDPDMDVFMKAVATEGQEANVITDYMLKVLGLEVCADTMVGDEMSRGISGGQKKRVTTGEMMVGPANALFMDEISTGLDSSTTFQIVNCLKQSVHILNGTAVISLLQPAPETYDLFDDIILLSHGRIVYLGPREHVLSFFESMGFKCPERKGVADFLQEVTSRKDQKQYWVRKDQPYRFVTANEFSEAFQSFHVGKKLRDELDVPLDKTKSHPAALTTTKYGIGKKELLKACISREYLLMKRNSFVYLFKSIHLTIMAFITMTLFLRTEMMHDSIKGGGIYTGAMTAGLVAIMFNGMSEISMTISKLPVFFKQRDLLFYPSWAYALPTWILKIPISFVEVSLWVFLTYYVIGFDPNVERLFRQYFILVLVNQMASGLFRFIAAASRNMVVANTFGSFALLVLFALGGFVLSRENIKKWWIWGYWISPLMYGQNALMVNEFLGNQWRLVLPGSNESLGITVLKSRGFFQDPQWYWFGVGGLLGFTISFEEKQTVISEEPEETEQTNEVGDKLQLSNNESSSSSETRTEVQDDAQRSMKKKGMGVSGSFRPGILTALMGVSGAGKTTLMDVLAGRKTGGYIEGNITVSGFPKKQETFARVSGYCEQNDIHSPHVTCMNPCSIPLGFDYLKKSVPKPERHAQVGLPGVNGLSTEQRKRLTIAVELVANPSIIFMDEPTSGLDARAAAIVMRAVRNTVDTGRTVVCTIHQPSIDIFEAFDELFLMKRGGQEIYLGPLGDHSKHLISYFEGIEGVGKIKDGYNPATWMLEVSTTAQELALGVDFVDIYKKSDLYRRNKALIEHLSKPAPALVILVQPSYTAVRFLFTTVIALMFGTLFWDLGTRTKKKQDLANAMGSMYAAVIFLGIQNAASVQPVVAVERTVFYRERAAGMYSAMPYAIAQASSVYGLIVYAMIAFEWTAVKFFWYLFFMYFTLLYFTFYGMMVVAVTPNHHIAGIVSSSFYGFWSLFSGFFIPRPSIPVWWRWYCYICPVSWTLYGLLVSQFGDIQDVLEDGQTVEQYLRNYFGFRHEFIGVVAAVIIAFTVLFGAIFTVSIKFFNFQKR